MKLSGGEKLILAMLCDIHQELGIKNGVNAKLVQEAIYSGNLWGVEWEHTGIFAIEEKDPATVSEVCDILDMWWRMELAYAKLTPEERARVAEEADTFGKDMKFAGFDGNNEGDHFSIARFLIDDLGRFTYFKGRDLNSHWPSIDGYRRMVELFLPMRKSLGFGGTLGADQIIALLNARIHPSMKAA